MAIDDLLIKLAKMFTKPKLQTVFLINNYDMTIAVLKVRSLFLSHYIYMCVCAIVVDLLAIIQFNF